MRGISVLGRRSGSTSFGDLSQSSSIYKVDKAMDHYIPWKLLLLLRRLRHNRCLVLLDAPGKYTDCASVRLGIVPWNIEEVLSDLQFALPLSQHIPSLLWALMSYRVQHDSSC